MNGGDDDCVSFSTMFNKWNKARTTATLIVDVPKDRLDEAKQAIAALGFKVK